MVMAKDWRKVVSFSERLSNTTEMQVSAVAWLGTQPPLTCSSISAYQTANPECQASEASTQAKAIEEQARRAAKSLVRVCPPRTLHHHLVLISAG
jgi:cyclin-dependent kinase